MADDIERERAIRRMTGMAVLRFSGAEVMYQLREVQAVLAAQVEAMAALREHGEAVQAEAGAVLDAVAALSAHRALRTDYTVRNSARSQTEAYDPADPFGDEKISDDVLREAGWLPGFARPGGAPPPYGRPGKAGSPERRRP